MKVNFKYEYGLIVSLSLLLLVLVSFSKATILRAMLGLPYTLFIPGYLLTAALFPTANALDVFDRAALSMGLSIIIVPFMGMLQNYMSLGIKLFPMTLSLTLLNVILAGVGWHIRKGLPEERRFEITLEVNLEEWQRRFKENILIRGAQLVASLVMFVVIIYMLCCPIAGSSFTEFYITGQDGMATGYPEILQAGEDGMVQACIINHEGQNAIYHVEIRVDGNLIQTITPISLNHLEKWEETVSFRITNANDAAKVDFLLFMDGQNTQPYRQLRLWVNSNID